MRLPVSGVIGVQLNSVSTYPGSQTRSLRSLAPLARPPLCYALHEAVLRSPLAPLARYARSLALVLRAPRGGATLSTRSARSLRSLARPCATRGVRPLSAPHSLCSGGGSGPRGSPVASRRPRPAASLCPGGACSCALPHCGAPRGGRCPCGACGVRLGLSPFPAGSLGRAGAGACSPHTRPPPCWGLLAPFPPRFLPLVCASVLPAMPPPTPPTPSHTPRGLNPRVRAIRQGAPVPLRGGPIGRTPSRIAPTLKGIAVGGRLAASLQPSPTLFVGYRLPIRIGMTRCLLPLSPLSSANKFVAALRRYRVARGPGSPRIGATARSCARGPASPLECFSFVCGLSITLQNRFGVSSSLFGCRGGSGSSPPLALSASCKRSCRCAIDPLRGERFSGARLPPLLGGKHPAQAADAPPLLFFRLPL